MGNDLVIIDTETTDSVIGSRVFEVAALRIKFHSFPRSRVANSNSIHCPPFQGSDHYVEKAAFSALLDAGGSTISAVVEDLTGVSTLDLPTNVSFGDVAPTLHWILDGAIPVAYNWPFDRRMLVTEFKRMDLPVGVFEPDLDWQALDPLAMVNWATKYMKGGRKLSQIADVCGYEMGRAHRALDDCHMTAYVLAAYAGAIVDKGFPDNTEKALAFIQTQNKMRDQSYWDWLSAQPTAPTYRQCSVCGIYTKPDDFSDHDCQAYLEWPKGPGLPTWKDVKDATKKDKEDE